VIDKILNFKIPDFISYFFTVYETLTFKRTNFQKAKIHSKKGKVKQ
jgi:hypothetical protein